jgi:Cu/Ag efflux pump CusA
MSFDLVLIYNTNRNSIEGIKNSLIDTYDGRKVPLKEIADIVSATGPNTISRENVQRVVISANVSGRDLRGVVNDVQKTIKEKLLSLEITILNMVVSLRVKKKYPDSSYTS